MDDGVGEEAAREGAVMSEQMIQISAGTGPVEVRRLVPALADALTARLAARGVEVEASVTTGSVEAPSSIGLVIGDFDVSYFFSADSKLSFGAGPEKNFQIGKSNLFASVGLALQLQLNSRDRLELRGAISFGISIKTN